MRFLGFSFVQGPSRYAVDVALLFRVMTELSWHILPWGRKDILGIANYQDWLIPLFDIRSFLPDESGRLGHYVFFLHTQEGLIGFPGGNWSILLEKKDIVRVVKKKEPVCPFLLHTKKGLFHFIDIRVILRTMVQKIWYEDEIS